MKAAFVKEAGSSGKPRLMITVAVAAARRWIDASYEVDKISEHLDFMSVMCYDFAGGWNTFTAHHSPLFVGSKDRWDFLYYNAYETVTYYLNKGAPRDKLLVGIATYGRSFKLASTSNNQLGAATAGGAPAAPITKTTGFMAYYEVIKCICDLLEGGERHWIEDQKVPYAVKGDVWVGYDDKQSVISKIEWVRQQKFAGAFVWTIDFDDVKNHCKQGSHPLVQTIRREFLGISVYLVIEAFILLTALRFESMHT
ncbi:chitinase-3-like protein 2 [Amblyraja radiata]|uniref:chitinase-3-like protein 2 n=1 Tax=Amblyraja radiata TaxID=386614 RepID=UPI001403470A|nr:chitinase-3-like protein 2 [Amblyraja radiata]